jgi:hypothetical protein
LRISSWITAGWVSSVWGQRRASHWQLSLTIHCEALALVPALVFRNEIFEVILRVGDAADLVLIIDEVTVSLLAIAKEHKQSKQLAPASLNHKEKMDLLEDLTSDGETSRGIRSISVEVVLRFT